MALKSRRWPRPSPGPASEPVYDMGSNVSSVVPPLRIDCLKNRIACPTCEPARPFEVLSRDAAIHPLRSDHEFPLHFPGASSLASKLRRLGDTQVHI